MSRISKALEQFQKKYGSTVKMGSDLVDVTHLFSTGSLPPKFKYRRTDERVLALPIYNGQGMFAKWRLNDKGKIERDATGRPKIMWGLPQIVAALVCTPDCKNTCSDELILHNEKSVEGVEKSRALAVFDSLGMSPKTDAYVLFVETPRTAHRAAAKFARNVTGALLQGSRWRPPVHLRLPQSNDPNYYETLVEQVSRQVHPLVIREMIADILKEKLAKREIRQQVQKALRPIQEKRRVWMGRTKR